MNYHSQEVCGLAWSPDGQFLASGANDNTLCIWDAASSLTLDAKPRHALCEHQAAVKALAWSPHERNLLATGGGTADRSIKFWNAQSGALLNSIDTGSQVCALQWSPFEKELLSSHGYAENLLCLWKYPTMTRMKVIISILYIRLQIFSFNVPLTITCFLLDFTGIERSHIKSLAYGHISRRFFGSIVCC